MCNPPRIAAERVARSGGYERLITHMKVRINTRNERI
tara:strand:+ start:1285 stop:1395 length:111 start_codon:yes stop_codon:yes gene_type:complete